MDHVLGIVTHIDHVGYTGNCHGLSISTPATASGGRLADMTLWDEFSATLSDTDGPSDVSVAVDPSDISFCPEIGVSYVGVEICTLILDAYEPGGIKEMYLTTHPPQWGSPIPFTSPYEYALPGGIDGQVTIYFKVVNYAGLATWTTCTIFKDTMNPVLDSYTIDGGATYTLDKTVSMTVGAHDEGLGIRGIAFCMDGVSFPRPQPFTDPVTTMDYTIPSGETDGLKTIYLRITDWAWHISNSIPRTIFLDENNPSNPTSSTSSPVVNTWSNDNTVTVTWSGASDGTGSGVNGYSILWSTVSTDIPDATVDTTLTTTTSSALANGASWYLHVRTKDNAGRWNTGAYHIGPFKIDTALPTNPTASMSSHTPGVPNTDTTIDITWSGATDALSGIQGYSFSWTQASGDIPDATVDTAGTSTTSPVLAAGNWYFHARTIDNAGNVATGAYHAGPFIIQSANSPPTAPGTPTWTSGDERDGVFLLTWTAASDTDPTPVARYEIQEKKDGGAWVTLSDQITVTSYTVAYRVPATYNYQVRAIDTAGLIGPWSPTSNLCTVPSQLRLTTNSGDSMKPAIAVDSVGNYHVVWQDSSDGNNEIYYMKLDANWNVLTAQTRLTSNSYDSVNPDIAVSSTGTIKVIWRDNRNGNYEIYLKTCTSGTWGADTRLTKTTSANDKEPDAEVDSTGNFYFVWHDSVVGTKGLTEKIWFSVNGASGTNIYTATGPKGATYDKISEPRLACGASGVIHLVFALGPAYPAETGTESIKYMKRTSSTWSSVSTLKANTGNSASDWVSIDADSAGNVYVAWSQVTNPATYTRGIGFIRSSNGGTSWNSDVVIPGTESASYNPEVTCLSNGRIYIGFYNCYETLGIIYCVKSLDYGATWQTIQAISPTSNMNVWYYGMCIDPNSGRVGVVWDCVGGNHTEHWEIYFAAKML